MITSRRHARRRPARVARGMQTLSPPFIPFTKFSPYDLPPYLRRTVWGCLPVVIRSFARLFSTSSPLLSSESSKCPHKYPNTTSMPLCFFFSEHRPPSRSCLRFFSTILACHQVCHHRFRFLATRSKKSFRDHLGPRSPASDIPTDVRHTQQASILRGLRK